jgi:outer membrane protein TolC
MFIRKTAVPVVLAIILTATLLPGALMAQETRDLSLMEALRIALDNNLDLVSARYRPALAEQDIEIQQSSFDLGLEATVVHSEQVQAATQSSTLSGSNVDRGTVGVQQNLKFGGNYTAGLTTVRQEQAGANVLAPTSYFSTLSFNFNIPLLKGFGVEDTTEQLILSRNALDVSLHDLEGNAETVVQDVEVAYWNMVASREALRISILSLDRAKDQLALNRKKVEVGTLAPIEITVAEAEVASQEESVIVAETGLRDAEDELRRLLAVPEGDAMWEQELIPAELPAYREVQVDLAAALEQAMASRPDIYSARQAVRDRELSQKIAQRGVRHQLDFDGGYSPTGASLPVIDFTDPLNPIILENPSLGDSFSNLPDLDQYSWNAQFTYRVPIGNRQAKAAYARAQISTDQASTDLQNLEQTIRVEVRRAARAVESGVKRVQAAKVNTVLQQKKLDAEQKKFENGMSTSFEVLTFQRDLANAELSEVRALLDYVKSLTALEKAKGTLLEARGLSL